MAKRHDNKKNKLELIPAKAIEEVGKVFTFGAEKYGEYNWQKGMDWTRMIGSMERHLNAIKRGEDFDLESGLLHSAHLTCNALMLTEYYSIHKQGDNRMHRYLKMEKIGLDIDEVLADFIGHYKKVFNIEHDIPFWTFEPKLQERLIELKDNKQFWEGITPLIKAKDLPFEPHCYITSRICNPEFTKAWLHANGFPSVPVFSVPPGEDKSKVALEQGLTMFVDDSYKTFVQMTKNNILCYLMNAPHNTKYDVGHKRIHSLKELDHNQPHIGATKKQ